MIPSADNPPESEATAGPAGGERTPCPMCGEMIVASAKKCRYCGHYLDPAFKPQANTATDEFLMPVNRPVSAIAAGYLGLFAVLPFFGLVAIVVALFALSTLKNHPELSGRGRAWFGLIAGIVFTLVYIAAILFNHV